MYRAAISTQRVVNGSGTPTDSTFQAWNRLLYPIPYLQGFPRRIQHLSPVSDVLVYPRTRKGPCRQSGRRSEPVDLRQLDHPERVGSSLSQQLESVSDQRRATIQLPTKGVDLTDLVNYLNARKMRGLPMRTSSRPRPQMMRKTPLRSVQRPPMDATESNASLFVTCW